MVTLKFFLLNFSSAVASGIFTIKAPIDNTMQVAFEAYNLSGGQYKKIFGRTVGFFCDTAYNPEYENVVRKLIASTNATIKYGDCPILPQTIQINDATTDNIGDILPEYIPGGFF
jgi:hypothetical protein